MLKEMDISKLKNDVVMIMIELHVNIARRILQQKYFQLLWLSIRCSNNYSISICLILMCFNRRLQGWSRPLRLLHEALPLRGREICEVQSAEE